MDKIRVGLRFGPDFQGELQAGDRTLPVGKGGQGFRPYELLLGALGACYYATFVDIAKKMRLQYARVAFEIEGSKREETPTTLKEATIRFTVYGAEDQKGFERANQLAGKYCSIHATLEKVAELSTELRFEPEGKDGQA